MVAGVVQKERGPCAAVEDVWNRQRSAKRRPVPLLHVVGFLAFATVERIRRGVEHRPAKGVVGVSLDPAAAAHASESTGAAEAARPTAARSPASPTAAAETTLIAAAAQPTLAATEAIRPALAKLAATAAPAKQQRVVRLPLNTGRRDRLGRRVSGKARRQLKLGAESGRRFLCRRSSRLLAGRVGDDVELLETGPDLSKGPALILCRLPAVGAPAWAPAGCVAGGVRAGPPLSRYRSTRTSQVRVTRGSGSGRAGARSHPAVRATSVVVDANAARDARSL